MRCVRGKVEEADRYQYEAGASMLWFVATVHRDMSV